MKKPSQISLIILVGAILLLSAVVSVQLWLQKKALYHTYINEKLTLTKENDSLRSQIEKIEDERKNLQDQLSDLDLQLKSLVQQKEALNGKLEQVTEKYALLQDENKTLAQARQNFESERASLENELSALRRKVDGLSSDEFVAGLLKEKATLESKLKELASSVQNSAAFEEQIRELQGMGDSLTQSVLSERKERLAREAEFEKARRDNLVLQAKVQEMTSSRDLLSNRVSELERALSRAEQENATLSDRLAGINQALQFKLAEIDRVKTVLEDAAGKIGASSTSASEPKPKPGVELPPIVVKAQIEPSLQNPKEEKKSGRVVTVNSEHNFVVVNLGRTDGIKNGTRLSVLRQNREIGELEVIEARERISAADIKGGDKLARIEKDDIVVVNK